MNRLCVVIDGNSLLHRAFHAIQDLTDASGAPTNAVYGFAAMLLKVLKERNPSHVAVAFDRPEATFRHKAYAAYKGTRKPTDERLIPQFGRVRAMLGQMGVAVAESAGYEADDILGTLAARCEAEGMPALLVTGDRDALQLVTEKTHVLYTKRGISDTAEFDPAGVLETYGVTPAQVPDLKGLMGDASDNIPGIPGIGEKTALSLLGRYGTLAGALNHAADEKGKLRERLETGRASAEQSLWLATICRTAPVAASLADFALGNLAEAPAALESLAFASLLPRLAEVTRLRRAEAAPAPSGAPAMPEAGADTSCTRVETAEALAALCAGLTEAALCVAEDALTLRTDKASYRVPLQLDLLSDGLPPREAFAALAPLFEKPGALALYDAKRVLHTAESLGLRARADCARDDARLSGWLLNPLAAPPAPKDAEALRAACARDAAALRETGMESLYRDMELPLMAVLLEMEREGFLVDRDTLARLGEGFSREEATLRAEVIALTGGEPFNLASPKQLGEVLFGKLNLPSGRKTKSGYSTDAETLEAIAHLHPAVEKLLKWRQVVKLNATYIDGLSRKIGPDGRVRSSFDQTATVTGRLSSNEPNLQNIPVRTEMGREIRRAFVARPGWTLVDADYSQIELRILAHLSGDANMIDAFRGGQDIHTRTAAEVYGVPPQEVTGAMRSAAKAVNFGIVYGISDFGLARNIGVERKEARAFIDRYFERYPGVKKFMDTAVAEGKALGYAKTLLGRRRPLPELLSANYNTRAFGERAAMNTPVQGAAADIIKLAMVRVARDLSDGGYRARLILQVHDELIVETPAEETEAVCALVKRCMETAATLRVPLTADIGTGATWYDAK